MNQPAKSLQVGLAFLAGTGLTLMMVAAGIGVVNETADSAALGLLFIIGLALLASGIIAWFAVVRPDIHFDDINQPMYHGHDHHDAHEAPSDEKALAEHH